MKVFNRIISLRNFIYSSLLLIFFGKNIVFYFDAAELISSNSFSYFNKTGDDYAF